MENRYDGSDKINDVVETVNPLQSTLFEKCRLGEIGTIKSALSDKRGNNCFTAEELLDTLHFGHAGNMKR